jgi:hypothetical protein
MTEDTFEKIRIFSRWYFKTHRENHATIHHNEPYILDDRLVLYLHWSNTPNACILLNHNKEDIDGFVMNESDDFIWHGKNILEYEKVTKGF